MPRIWLSGPRLFGGLVRSGISFSASGLRAKERREITDEEVVRAFKEHPGLVALVILSYIFKWIFIVTFLLVVGWFLMASWHTAHAGTCHVYQDGGQTVQSCENGTFTVRDQHGHVRQYGERNGGFERYPGRR